MYLIPYIYIYIYAAASADAPLSCELLLISGADAEVFHIFMHIDA